MVKKRHLPVAHIWPASSAQDATRVSSENAMMVSQIIDTADFLDDNSTHGFRRRRFPHQLAETGQCLNRAAHFDDPNQLPCFIIMPLKQQLWYLARAASSKKRKSEASSLFNLPQPQIDKDKLSTGDTSNTGDTQGVSGTWFWNQSANKTESDSEEEDESEIDEKNWRKNSLGRNKS